MSRVNAVLTSLAAAVVIVTVVPDAGLLARQAATRKTFVTVVDNQGQPVSGLTAADFTLKEGGKDREIVSVEAAKAKMRIAVAVEETLTPAGGVRQGIADFMQKMLPQAEIALVVMGLSNRMAVPYTSDPAALMAGINALPLAQRQQQSHVADGIGDLARTFTKERPERPVMVVIAVDSPQASADQPQNILNALRDSNAQLHVVSIDGGSTATSAAQAMEMSGLSQVLGDGPKQSAGRQWPVTALTAVPRAMLSVANDLSNQYVISYTLPDGVKPSDRLAITIKRRGVTMRSATKISDK